MTYIPHPEYFRTHRRRSHRLRRHPWGAPCDFQNRVNVTRSNRSSVTSRIAKSAHRPMRWTVKSADRLLGGSWYEPALASIHACPNSVLMEGRGPVVLLTLNRPDKLNALDAATIDRLTCLA